MSKAKTSNHAKAPICAAFVEAMREAFGEDQVRVLYVKEGDFEIGGEQPRGVPAVFGMDVVKPNGDEA